MILVGAPWWSTEGCAGHRLVYRLCERRFWPVSPLVRLCVRCICPTTNPFGMPRHGNVSVFLLGSSMPGFSGPVSSCSSKDADFSLQNCNVPSATLGWLNPGEWVLEALKSKYSRFSMHGPFPKGKFPQHSRVVVTRGTSPSPTRPTTRTFSMTPSAHNPDQSLLLGAALAWTLTVPFLSRSTMPLLWPATSLRLILLPSVSSLDSILLSMVLSVSTPTSW